MMAVQSLNTSTLLEASQRQRPLSTCRKTFLMVACMYIQFLTNGTGNSFSVIYVEIIKMYDAPRALVAAIQSTYFMLLQVESILLASFIKKLGLSGACLVGSMLMSAGVGFAFLGSNVLTFLALLGGVAGSGACFLYYTSFLVIKTAFAENSAPMLALLMAGGGLGQTVLPFLTDLLIETYALKGTCLILAGVILNSVLCAVWIYLNEIYFPEEYVNRAENSSPKIPLKLARNGVFILIVFCAFQFFATGIIEGLFIVDLMVIRGYGMETGSLFATAIGFASLCGRILVGFLLYFFSIHALVHGAIFFFILAISHAMVILMTTYPGILIGCVLNGLVTGGIQSLGPSLLITIAGDDAYNHAIAVYLFLSGVGCLLSGIIGGAINDATGSYDLWFFIAIGSALVCCVIYMSVFAFIKSTNWSITGSKSNGYTKL